MARQLRIEYPGAVYHVTARGDLRESIYLDDEDRSIFLKTVGEACGMTGWRIHAWVLMDNHYHLMIQTPEANLVDGMKWVQNAYTRHFNVRHKLRGRLFGDRYKSVLVEAEGYYYQTLIDYIHLNPVRAGLVRVSAGQSVLEFPWSSVAGGYRLKPGQRVPWLAAVEGLNAFGLSDTAAGRRRFVERIDRRALEEGAAKAGIPTVSGDTDARCSHLQRGWYWGSQAFGEQMLKLGGKLFGKTKRKNDRSMQEPRAHGEGEAQRILASGMQALGLNQKEIARTSGCEERKVAIAKMIWKRTTVSQEWIALRLGMKSRANVSHLIKRSSSSKTEKLLEQAVAVDELSE